MKLTKIFFNEKKRMLMEVKKDGFALEHASDELKNDKEIVIAAVSQRGGALQFASKELRGDIEVVIAALKTDRYALDYVNEDFLADREENGQTIMTKDTKMWILKSAIEDIEEAYKTYYGLLETVEKEAQQRDGIFKEENISDIIYLNDEDEYEYEM